jgi:glycosyltransferase involved in cell wall biosynthesis
VLKDLYPHADLVTFPSTYEGFGNALLEAIYFKVPVLVNRYKVFVRDIEPKGLKMPTMNGFIDRKAVIQVRRLLDDPGYREEVTSLNYAIAEQYYSYDVLRYGLQTLINNILNRTD